MHLVTRRERNQPIYVGTEQANGTDVHFHLLSNRRLAFETAEGQNLLAFGLPVVVRGTVKLTPGFGVHSIETAVSPPESREEGKPAPFDEGDRDRALELAVQKAASAAASRLLERSMPTVAAAWMDHADDHALGRMSYRQYCAARLEELSESGSWREEGSLQDQMATAEREADSVDEEAHAYSWLHATRPGYVVLCEGKPVDRGESRFRDDRGTGWISRHVFSHLSAAHAFAQEISRDKA